MKKQIIAAVLGLGLTLSSATALAAADNVRITLPEFKVTLNGTLIDNAHSQYPLIVYNDITYFPMTYYDCRFLGLETGWANAESGLFIDSTGITGAYNPYTQKNKNSKSATAQKASFPITVNGQKIDNAAEQYPLLVYRDVTYFPMTWRFCVNEFGWQYAFDQKEGLRISSANSLVSYGALPEQTKEADLRNAVATDGEYVYYVAGKDHSRIMRAPLTDLNRAQTVYELPINYYTDTYVWPYLWEKDGQVYLNYHIGGATMGSEKRFLLSKSGEAVDLEADNFYVFSYPQAEFRYYAGAWPGSENLFMRLSGGDWQNIGEQGYTFGWNWYMDSHSEGGSSTGCGYFDGSKYFYIAGFNQKAYYEKHQKNPNDYSEKTGIYRIDVATNETVRLTPEDAHIAYFVNDDNYLYYLHDDTFCRYDLKSGETSVIPYQFNEPNRYIDCFCALNGNIYAITAQAGAGGSVWTELLKITSDGQAEVIEEAKFATAMMVQDNYLLVTCREAAEVPYRTLVLDQNGAIVFKSADVCYLSGTCIKDGTLWFYNQANEQICKARLK